jgi:hypothetical protein
MAARWFIGCKGLNAAEPWVREPILVGRGCHIVLVLLLVLVLDWLA